MKPTWYVVIGPNVYGQSGKTAKEAIKSAVSYYGTGFAQINRAKFKVYKVSDDFEISLDDGSITATTIVPVCWVNWSGTILQDEV